MYNVALKSDWLAGEEKQLVTPSAPSPGQQWELAATRTTMQAHQPFQIRVVHL